MTRICICDDSEEARYNLSERLTQTGLFDNAAYTFFSDGKELLSEMTQGTRFDFIFLDAEMPKLDGPETGRRIYELDKTCVIIFVSSYPQYAIEAFDCHAFAYLLKGADEDKFLSVLKSASEKHKLGGGYRYLATRNGNVFCPLSEIYYIECFRKQLIYYTEKGTYKTRELISDVQSALENFGFCRVHKGYTVNLSKVHHLSKTDVILTDGSKVPISTRKKSYVIESFNDYIRRYVL